MTLLSLLALALGVLGAPVGSGGWAWPVTPPVVVRPFVAPAQVWAPGHRGVDLAAAVSQPVRSPAAGRVVFAGVVVDRPVLVVEHAGGVRSSFEPVTSGLTVGTSVARGDPIGAVGGEPGHCAPDTCVHWGVRSGDRYLDPLSLMSGRVVLLPLTDR